MGERQPIGVISIGSNDIHLLVAASDGTTTFEKKGEPVDVGRTDR